MRPPHRLDPLLRPRSIALVGASPREGSVGAQTLAQLKAFGFEGRIWPVNPRNGEIGGLRAYASAAELPEAPDLTVLAVPNAGLEQAFAAAIAKGTKAAAIFASGFVEGDGDPPLNRRLARMAAAAGIPVCGSNGMGFYNYADRVAVCGFKGARRELEGGAVLITHSGSVLSALCDCEQRIGYALAVSTGNELVTGLADYIDFALASPQTTAIAVFMETARQPAEFVAALARAAERDVPVIVLKVGRTALAAELAVSHSGALAGDHAAYRAVFRRYGVIEVDTLDEMAATLMLMTSPRRAKRGGLATMHDSGGERGLWIDRAEEVGVPFAALSEATRAKLAARLDYGLPAVNPLDAWGTGRDYEAVYADCLAALAEDGDTGLAYFAFDREGGSVVAPDYAGAAIAAFERTDRPVAIVASRHGSGGDPAELDIVRRGVPVIDGEWWALKAARHAFAYRDFRARPPMALPTPPRAATLAHWRERLRRGDTLDEAESLTLLTSVGVPATAFLRAASLEEAVMAADDMGYPVALKTAAPGLAHKSEQKGVRLGLASRDAVAEAYRDIAARLGPDVLIAAMAPPGVEIALGVVVDPSFGPLVMIGGGGVTVELYRDCTFLLAPFDAATAEAAIRSLKVAQLLEGFRGGPRCDVRSAAEAAARLSVAAAALGDDLAEIDVNPLIVGVEGSIAVDGLVVPRRKGPGA